MKKLRNFKKILAVFFLTLVIWVFWVNGSIQDADFQLDSHLPEQIQAVRPMYVPEEEIPEVMFDAIVKAEDHRYYYHFGIDPIGILRAALVNLEAGEVVEGGSTLTQQLAKNLFLTPERTMTRKLKDMTLAVELEVLYSKREIICMYLNAVYFGEGAYGIGEAAETYFQKSVSKLTREECAILAAIPRAPSTCNPFTNQVSIGKRQQKILAMMNR